MQHANKQPLVEDVYRNHESLCFLVVATRDCCMLVAIHLPEPQPFVFFLRTVCLFAFMACAASSLLLVF